MNKRQKPERLLGLSISGSNDLLSYGFGEEHLRELLIRVCQPIIRDLTQLWGHEFTIQLAYGGTIGKGSFAPDLLDLIGWERSTDEDDDSKEGIGWTGKLYNPCPWPYYQQITPACRAEFINTCKFVRITQQMAGLREDEIIEFPPPGVLTPRIAYNHSRVLTVTRQIMSGAKNIFMHKADKKDQLPPLNWLIAVGGKVTGFTGIMPTLYEQVRYALDPPSGAIPIPLYILGGFGGAAHELAIALLGKENDALHDSFTVQYHQQHSQPAYGLMLEGYQKYGRKLGLQHVPKQELAHLSKLCFEARGNLAGKLINGLSTRDNEILLQSSDISEIARLVFLGMQKVIHVSRETAYNEIWKGADLARAGKIDDAINAFSKAQQLFPGVNLNFAGTTIIDDPELAASQAAASDNLWRAEAAARVGKKRKATAIYEKTRQHFPRVHLNPDSDNVAQDPEAVVKYWAQRARAERKCQTGIRFAKEFDIKKATAAFSEARKLSPRISLDPDSQFEFDDVDPETFARQIAAAEMRVEGERWALDGDIEAAITAYQKMLEFFPDKEFESEKVAKQLYASAKREQGERLAQQGNLADAFTAFKEAKALFPGIDLNPRTDIVVSDANAIARQWLAAARRDKGAKLAWEGYITGAIEIFQKAQQAFPGIDLDPYSTIEDKDADKVARHLDKCAKKFNRANAKYEKGLQLARKGKLNDAVAAFKKVAKMMLRIDLDPELDSEAVHRNVYPFVNFDRYKEMKAIGGDPDAVAHQVAANTKREEGEKLAGKGDLRGAITAFDAAKKLVPDIALLSGNQDSEAVARAIAASGKLDEGMQLAQEGEIEGATTAYKAAQKLDPSLVIDAMHWNLLGWKGTLFGYANDVMFACEKAVELDPVDGDCLDTRGLARALTGDIPGAIEDFEAFIELESSEFLEDDDIAQRQHWIEEMRQGRNPFTAQELDKLRTVGAPNGKHGVFRR